MLANKRGRSFCLARAKTVDIIQRQTRIACVFTQLSRPAVFVAVYLALYFKGVGILPTVYDGIQSACFFLSRSDDLIHVRQNITGVPALKTTGPFSLGMQEIRVNRLLRAERKAQRDSPVPNDLMKEHINGSVHRHTELRKDCFCLGFQLGINTNTHINTCHENHLCNRIPQYGAMSIHLRRYLPL